jgi:hypothetical protein
MIRAMDTWKGLQGDDSDAKLVEGDSIEASNVRCRLPSLDNAYGVPHRHRRSPCHPSQANKSMPIPYDFLQ